MKSILNTLKARINEVIDSVCIRSEIESFATMNKAFILQILALSGEFIASVTPEWCTVMQSVYKTRIVTVQDTIQQIRRHYFWRNSFENIPINYTRIEVSRSDKNSGSLTILFYFPFPL